MRKVISFPLITLLIALMMTPFMTSSASAWFSPFPEENFLTQGFQTWKWEDQIVNNHMNGDVNAPLACEGSCSPLPLSTFNKTASSYVVYAPSSIYPSDSYYQWSGNIYATRFYIAVAPVGKRIIFYYDSVAGDYGFKVSGGGNLNIIHGNYFNGSTYINNQNFGQTSGGGTATYISDVAAISRAVNVDYAASWGGAQKFSGLPLESGNDVQVEQPTCSVTDIWCWVKSIFVPDSQWTIDRLDQFKAVFVSKIGYLAQLGTVFSSIWSPFGSGYVNWCTSSSCTKNFGNLFGSPVTVDFLTLHNSMPTIETLVLTVIRITTVLGFIFMVRKRYLTMLMGGRKA